MTEPDINDIPQPPPPFDALDALRAKLAEHLPPDAMPGVETALAAAVRQATGEALVHVIRSLKPARGPMPRELAFLESALGLEPIDGEECGVSRQRIHVKAKELRRRVRKTR